MPNERQLQDHRLITCNLKPALLSIVRGVEAQRFEPLTVTVNELFFSKSFEEPLQLSS